MKTSDARTQWKELLPQTFAWIDQVGLSSTDKEIAGAHHVVFVKAPEQKDGEFSIEAQGLEPALKSKIRTTAKALGYVSACGPLSLMCGEMAFTLIPQNTLAVSAVQRARQAGFDAANTLRDRPIKELVLCATDELPAWAIWQGLVQGLYALEGFKGEVAKKQPLPEKVWLCGSEASTSELVKANRALAKATTLTRMIEDAPPNWLNPTRFAQIASDVASELGIACTLLGRRELEEQGMGCFLSVAQGSAVEPQLIVLEIKGQRSDRKVALVGKGLTFDAGGLCLKPAANMGEMKYDMCGGAAVLGAAYYFGHDRPPVDVICVIGVVENLIGEKASRPGDIVKAMNGKTVEILNTDAEGRLVLADCLHYTDKRWQPDLMVDVATLTGAVLMALGSCGSALLTNDQKAGDFVLNAAKEVGEPLWQLPLWPELGKEMKSEVADLKNIPNANVKAGVLTAGCFLREFVGDRRWVHLDIAGTGWNCRATGYPAAGGSAFGLRTLIELCQSFPKASL